MTQIEINTFVSQVDDIVRQMESRLAAAPAAIAEKNRPALERCQAELARLRAGEVQFLRDSKTLIPNFYLAKIAKG